MSRCVWSRHVWVVLWCGVADGGNIGVGVGNLGLEICYFAL